MRPRLEFSRGDVQYCHAVFYKENRMIRFAFRLLDNFKIKVFVLSKLYSYSDTSKIDVFCVFVFCIFAVFRKHLLAVTLHRLIEE